MPEPRTRTFAELSVGDRGEFSFTMTPEYVDEFARFSGNYNPLHVPSDYAKTTQFGEYIPHGMIAGALFSRLIGMEIPGTYALCLSQNLVYEAPLPLSGSITIMGEVLQKIEAAHCIRLKTVITDAQGKTLVRGEALVQLLDAES